MQSGTLGKWVVAALVIALTLPAAAYADTADAVRDVLKTVDGPNIADNSRTSLTPEGYLKFLGAPNGNSYQPSTGAKAAGGPDAIAKSFLVEHGPAFGISDAGVGFVTARVKSENARSVVRLNQVYNGVPVFGAQAVVQLKADGSIVSILSDIMREAPRVYSGALPLAPTLNAGDAEMTAVDVLQTEQPSYTFDAGKAVLYLFAPSVLGQVGQVKLVYSVEVIGEGDGMPAAEQILIDAHTGATVMRIPKVYEAKSRTIYDAENVPFVDPGTLKRSEGDPVTGISDVDEAYDYYGDTYDFYFTRLGRDGIDDLGMTMDATVRWCPDSFDCPLFNAFWYSAPIYRMYFGDGFTVDDVVGHELTHGVTDFESNLIYSYESGALNESFSDVFGEFIDQTNGAGVDTPGVKWLLGEELGAIRDMANPPHFFDPDRYKGPNWYTGNFDNGGVHINSGVSNKLCYLLTDGDLFNGFTVAPMGIDTVAALYYRCQTALLGPASDYPDFGDAMVQAAEDIGLGGPEAVNVLLGLVATEIKKPELLPLRHFRATGKAGDTRIALTWLNPTVGGLAGVDIVRRTDRFPENAGDGTLIASITDGAQSYIDTLGGSVGANRFYGIFPHEGSYEINVPLYTRGTVGVDVDFMTESFSNGTDLAYSQITFVPTGALPFNIDLDHITDFYNHTNYGAYTASQSKDFDGTLPVAKEDFYEIPLPDDGTAAIPLQVPVPFFGRFLSQVLLSANGYLASAEDQYDIESLGNDTSLANHFEKPRISFLFGDLNPRAGGEVWLRYLDDRLAITFENVPLFDPDQVGGGAPGQNFTNTVQVELFNSGQIRCTYLNLTAKRAIVGLSDGRGIPLNVDDVFAGVVNPRRATSNLNALPGSVGLEFLPIATQFVEPGTPVEFTAHAESTIGTPVYGALEPPAGLGISPMTGASIDPNTGAFTWDTTGVVDGGYGIILCATAGGQTACQIVGAFVVSSTVLPQATNLSLAPAKPKDGDNLVANYTYVHPSIPQGPSVVYWFRDHAIIPAYTNHLLLPHEATSPGELWYFLVLPATVQVASIGSENVYLYGDSVKSAEVTIAPDLKVDTNGDGKVNTVDLQLVVRGLLGTAAPGIDPDVNGDGQEDASDIQTTINYILEKR